MAELFIYDVIGRGFMEDGVTAEGVRDELSKMRGERVDLRLNTPGGDVFEAVAIKTLLDRHDGEVHTHVDGVAASCGSFLAVGGKTVTMAEGSMMMIHDPWSVTIGDKAEHEKTVTLLEKTADNIAAIYAQQSGKPIEEIRDVMAAETWFTAEEAVDFGLATVATEGSAKAYTIPEAFGYKNTPKIENKRRPITVAAMERHLSLTRVALDV